MFSESQFTVISPSVNVSPTRHVHDFAFQILLYADLADAGHKSGADPECI